MTSFRRLSLAATIVTLTQIGSGGLVRATGSGDGCPDWPRCFGRWIPPLEYHALIEYSHRFIASAAIILVVATAVVAIRRFRHEPRVLWPSVIAGLTIFGLAGIGAAVVKTGLNETTVTVHIAIAMLLIGTLVYGSVNAWCLDRFQKGTVKGPADPVTARLSLIALVATFGLILLGADVRGSGAALVFGDWPLMNGSLIPELGGLATRHFLHRLGALVAGLAVAALVAQALRAKPRELAVAAFASVAGVLFVAQSLVGASQIWTGLAWGPVFMHVWISAMIWAALVAAFTVTRRLAACTVPLPGGSDMASMSREGSTSASPTFAGRMRAYVSLMKPRIILLLLVTTVPTMILAKGGLPRVWLILATLIGGTLAAGSANAVNCYVDRDIDSVMKRTQRRPLPMHQIEPPAALRFGIALGVIAFAWLAWQVNVLSALLATSAILFYVFVYTLGLKRSTPQNIVIGGAAGAVPVLVGWAAVTGSLSATPVTLFLVIYYWTPPHFWALAMNYERDYAAAKVPMLPVIASVADTTRQILLYSLLLIAVTLLLFPVAEMGLIYLVTAVLLGGTFLWYAMRLRRNATPKFAMGLFKYSITYLTLLFGAVAVDTLVHVRT